MLYVTNCTNLDELTTKFRAHSSKFVQFVTSTLAYSVVYIGTNSTGTVALAWLSSACNSGAT